MSIETLTIGLLLGYGGARVVDSMRGAAPGALAKPPPTFGARALVSAFRKATNTMRFR